MVQRLIWLIAIVGKCWWSHYRLSGDGDHYHVSAADGVSPKTWTIHQAARLGLLATKSGSTENSQDVACSIYSPTSFVHRLVLCINCVVYIVMIRHGTVFQVSAEAHYQQLQQAAFAQGASLYTSALLLVQLFKHQYGGAVLWTAPEEYHCFTGSS